MSSISHIILTSFFLFTLIHATCQSNVSIEKVNRNSYQKYEWKIENRSITYYLSEFNKEKKLPLVIYIQGSGWQSLFQKQGENILPTLGHATLTDLARDRFKVLIVEKPGVQFLDQMNQNERNVSFDRQFSLENWSERIQNVIEHVIQTEKVDSNRIMLMGHSEGGLVTARVSKLMKGKISKVCILAGEGPSQLYSLTALAQSGDVFRSLSDNPQERVDYLYDKWQHILDHPESVTDYFFGFTYKRWSSFMGTSVIDELADYSGSVYILQGDQDKNVFPESARVLYSSLLSKGINCRLEIIEGADHSFYQSDKPAINGWKNVLEKSIDWFLNQD